VESAPTISRGGRERSRRQESTAAAGTGQDPAARAGADLPDATTLERPMPLVTAFNLRTEDRLSDIEAAVREALVSMPELHINEWEIDLVPVYKPDGFHGTVTRINIDFWERPERTKAALQELATRVARAFQRVAGSERNVKVVIRPYDVERSGWVSF